ncbi:M1 family metallopeptidase [Filimonas effusa]|uniref:M1 family peptidase n=1 Tax=Filimonas effusa TaxID=2508721 RepID=A0A4Q1D8D8_9BACT|nr:M1 family metallopeptidase [Filimonas effusa]RXK85597.1 M1 family peptidase [Filimonas effusa]
MKPIIFSGILCCCFFTQLRAQHHESSRFTHADTLRGSITPERAWWNVLHYAITVKPDFNSKTISGSNTIRYKVTSDSYPAFMQIDLQEPMLIDSVLFGNSRRSLRFTREGNAWHVNVPKQANHSEGSVTVYFHGKPREAVNAPWDGGWIWRKDSTGSPWMSVACQGLGASVWYPCKDHQSDEPDQGASLSMIVADSLTAISNGRLAEKTGGNGFTTWKWQVVNPINNYNIVPYIGKYVHFSDTLHGEKGTLDLDFWVLQYNLARAQQQFVQAKQMLRAFEYWFGPYPFYEDSYKLVESPHLGMEHQSAVAYGNHFANGYLGRDLSGSGWGEKWDFILVHESGHEWFANNITSNDLADMWIHESFTNYSETLFTEYYYGKEAGTDYNYGTRKNIKNDRNIIAPYDVNDQGSGDMYYKGGNLIHTIRHSIDNDSLFRQILRGLNKTFYHKTVTTQEIEQYISRQSGIDLSKVFDQYLRTTQIPVLEYSWNKNKLRYRYTNCIPGFNLPIVLRKGTLVIRLTPADQWQTIQVDKSLKPLIDKKLIDRQYYITVQGARK